MAVHASMLLARLAIIATVSLVLLMFHRAREGRFWGAGWVPIVVAVLVAPVSYVLSVVVGGTLGGGVGATFGERLGLAQTSAIVPVGIGIGMWLVGAAPIAAMVTLAGFTVLRPRRRD